MGWKGDMPFVHLRVVCRAPTQHTERPDLLPHEAKQDTLHKPVSVKAEFAATLPGDQPHPPVSPQQLWLNHTGEANTRATPGAPALVTKRYYANGPHRTHSILGHSFKTRKL